MLQFDSTDQMHFKNPKSDQIQGFYGKKSIKIPNGVTWITRNFQQPIIKSFQKPVKPKLFSHFGFIHPSSDWWAQCFFRWSNIQKDKKLKWATYYFTPWRKTFSSISPSKRFLIVLTGAPNPLLVLQIFRCRLLIKKNILGNLKNWFTSHRDIFAAARRAGPDSMSILCDSVCSSQWRFLN